MHENRPSEGPFYGVCGTVHAGMTLLMLLSASVSRTATERRLIMLANYIYSIVQLMRQYSSRRSSTELQDSPARPRASLTGTVRPSGPSTNIKSSSSAVVVSMTALGAVTAVQRARSRDHFRTSQLSLRRCSAMPAMSVTAGSGWPERLRIHFMPLGTRYGPYLGTSEPKARPDRGKWLHGSPAESGVQARCKRLQVAAQNIARRRKREYFY